MLSAFVASYFLQSNSIMSTFFLFIMCMEFVRHQANLPSTEIDVNSFLFSLQFILSYCYACFSLFSSYMPNLPHNLNIWWKSAKDNCSYCMRYETRYNDLGFKLLFYKHSTLLLTLPFVELDISTPEALQVCVAWIGGLTPIFFWGAFFCPHLSQVLCQVPLSLTFWSQHIVIQDYEYLLLSPKMEYVFLLFADLDFQ